ncbi:MAG TPA: hypothetical protein VIB78_01145 [Acidimicrobiia bacterium]|jgi:hypothetical protein
MNTDTRNGPRLGVIIGLIVAALVVAAAVVNAVRPPEQFSRDTPEGTVQAFLLALNDENYDGAHALLSEDSRDECTPADLVRDRTEATRIVVDDVVEAGQTVIVDLDVTVTEASDGFEPYRYETEMSFTLVREGGTLFIDELPYYIFCSGV